MHSAASVLGSDSGRKDVLVRSVVPSSDHLRASKVQRSPLATCRRTRAAGRRRPCFGHSIHLRFRGWPLKRTSCSKRVRVAQGGLHRFLEGLIEIPFAEDGMQASVASRFLMKWTSFDLSSAHADTCNTNYTDRLSSNANTAQFHPSRKNFSLCCISAEVIQLGAHPRSTRISTCSLSACALDK